MRHAKRAQTVKFGIFLEDDDALDTVTDEYLAAVRSHDAHTREEQEANIGRMTLIYDRLLAAIMGMDPLLERVAARKRGQDL